MIDDNQIDKLIHAFQLLKAQSPETCSDDLLPASEAYDLYATLVDRFNDRQFDLGAWLPSFRQHIRPLIPGEVCVILADTGQGKTALVQSLALACPNLKVVLFELELPVDLVVERFLSMTTGKPGSEIEKFHRAGGRLENPTKGWDHVWTCKRSGLSVADMETILIEGAKKIGAAPSVVIVDYAGLVRGYGKTIYEKTTQVAVEIKNLARKTETIVFLTSQIHRQEGEEIGLHDAKDSGQIENSAGLILAAWRDKKEPDRMKIRILKSTKGGSGRTIEANFDGPTMRIWEKNDVPTKVEAPPEHWANR